MQTLEERPSILRTYPVPYGVEFAALGYYGGTWDWEPFSEINQFYSVLASRYVFRAMVAIAEFQVKI